MGKQSNKKPDYIFNYSEGKSHRVRLRGTKLANGSISLYLDYYLGYSKDSDDKIKTRRKVEYLKLYLFVKPRDSMEREKNKEILQLAQDLRNKRESDLQHGAEGLIAPFRKKSNLFDFFTAYIKNYQKKDIRMVMMAKRDFLAYTKEEYLTPSQINPTIIKGFRDHLLGRHNGETPNSVFARFKKVLKDATDAGLFVKNPADGIVCSTPKDGVQKEILMPDEILKMARAKCSNSEVKRAFLLCLNTGLRFVDVEDLRYKHISNGKIKKHQQKTGRAVSIDLNPTASNLIGEMGEPEEKVFALPSLTGALKTLKTWAKAAGINRNITWHSARHSFATILLMNKTDIKTVGSLLGHSKLDHTQKYTHVVDRLKTEAVNSLPDFELN